MADASMMILTILAAGAVVVGTGLVAVRADSSRQNYMTRGAGRMMLGLCSSDNLKTFEKVVHSELDDTPGRGGLRYNVVVRDCQTDDPLTAWRRFRSYMEEARQAAGGGAVGVVVDAYGLMAMLMSLREPSADRFVPAFAVALSPVDLDTPLSSYETMSCERPGEQKDARTVDDLGKMRDELRKPPGGATPKVRAIVLASLESPFSSPDLPDAQFRGTPTRGFLTFDKNEVCASWMAGGAFTAEELAQARIERERLEREASSGEPRFAEEVAAEAKRAREAVFRGEVRGRRYCKGFLRDAVDDLASASA